MKIMCQDKSKLSQIYWRFGIMIKWNLLISLISILRCSLNLIGRFIKIIWKCPFNVIINGSRKWKIVKKRKLRINWKKIKQDKLKIRMFLLKLLRVLLLGWKKVKRKVKFLSIIFLNLMLKSKLILAWKAYHQKYRYNKRWIDYICIN